MTAAARRPSARWLPALLAAALACGASAADVDRAALRDLLPVMITVPAGEFSMGSAAGDPLGRDDERPRHRVVISRDFQLAATEVDQGLWRAVMPSPSPYFSNHGDRGPAESLNWHDAVAFCNALSERLGLQPPYVVEGDAVLWNREADGFRLPTEAEWEYACRAGSTTAFATGGCLTTGQANFDGYKQLAGCPEGLFREEPLPVGSFAPNAWGFFDMHGNVHEWCWDTRGEYPAGEVVDPVGPAGGALRGLRGGGWISAAAGCRSAVRYFIPPDRRFDFVGLRLARSLPAASGPATP